MSNKKNDTPAVTITNAAARPFYRGGHLHPLGATAYEAGRFNAAQLAAMRDDPFLTVAETETETKAPAKKTAKADS